MKIPVIYKEKTLDVDFRCDLFIEQSIVVELNVLRNYYQYIKHNL